MTQDRHWDYECYQWRDPEELAAALAVAAQALREIAHAHREGARWYTRGEQGLRQHVGMWMDRGLKAANGALAPETT